MSADLRRDEKNNLYLYMYLQLSPNEVKTICSELGIEYESLAGTTQKDKVRELIIYMDRHGRLDELISYLDEYQSKRVRPKSRYFSQPTDNNRVEDIQALSFELAGLRQQLDELKKGSMSDEHLSKKLEEMVKTTTRAIGRSEELTARVFLPPPELTDVKLLPAGALERLEEYRSDENLAYLLIGAFTGAILGILSNWATNDPFVITRFSIVLLILLIILTGASIFWALRLSKRATKVKQHIFPFPHPTTSED